MSMPRDLTLQSCRPNGHYLALKYTPADAAWPAMWYVDECTAGADEEDVSEFDTLAEAQAWYDTRKVELATLPNWDAQERYDEAHGTDNGYAPWQYGREE